MMEQKTLFEQLGGTYSQQGDYLLPDVKLPEQKPVEIGIWGERRKEYLKAHHRVTYYNLLTSCRLAAHLADIDQQANKMEEQLVDLFAAQENLTEQLKADDMMTWVRRMNNIRSRVREIIMTELICV